MELVITYLLYIIAIIATIFIFTWFFYKVEINHIKHKMLNDLMNNGYECKNIDLNKFIK